MELGNYDELVAAVPGDGIGAAEDASEAGGELREQLVAGFVPVRVVHGLEPVDVEEEHRDRVLVALGARQAVGEPVQEQVAVGQAGERIVQRLVRQQLLHPSPSRDVAAHDQHAAHRGLVQEVGQHQLDPSPHAVGVTRPHVATFRRAG